MEYLILLLSESCFCWTVPWPEGGRPPCPKGEPSQPTMSWGGTHLTDPFSGLSFQDLRGSPHLRHHVSEGQGQTHFGPDAANWWRVSTAAGPIHRGIFLINWNPVKSIKSTEKYLSSRSPEMLRGKNTIMKAVSWHQRTNSSYKFI